MLSDTEGDILLTVIEALVKSSTSEDFLRCVQGELQLLLPHEIMICGIGSTEGNKPFIYKMLHSRFPLGFLEKLRSADGKVDSPMINDWLITQEPQLVDIRTDADKFTSKYVAAAREFNIYNTVAHGMLDLLGQTSSYFSFSQLPGALGPRHSYLLKLLIPHLHLALVRALAGKGEEDKLEQKGHPRLSERQKQILRKLHEGKTNWEIAQVLELSDNNVKYHIKRILTKLQVKNRTQALAKAIDLGIIQPTRRQDSS